MSWRWQNGWQLIHKQKDVSYSTQLLLNFCKLLYGGYKIDKQKHGLQLNPADFDVAAMNEAAEMKALHCE